MFLSNLLKITKKKKLKILLKLKNNLTISCLKIKSKIFYNLTFFYIKNNFSLINKLLNINIKQIFLQSKSYELIDNKIYNDSFILNYLESKFDSKIKIDETINSNKKSITIVTILRKILFLNKSFLNLRILKKEKKFIKRNIYKIFFFLFYYYFKNILYYKLFLFINNKIKKKKLFNLIFFLKKKLKTLFIFFFKNIAFFIFKFLSFKNKPKIFLEYFLKKKKRKSYNKSIKRFFFKKYSKKISKKKRFKKFLKKSLEKGKKKLKKKGYKILKILKKKLYDKKSLSLKINWHKLKYFNKIKLLKYFNLLNLNINKYQIKKMDKKLKKKKFNTLIKNKILIKTYLNKLKVNNIIKQILNYTYKIKQNRISMFKYLLKNKKKQINFIKQSLNKLRFTKLYAKKVLYRIKNNVKKKNYNYEFIKISIRRLKNSITKNKQNMKLNLFSFKSFFLKKKKKYNFLKKLYFKKIISKRLELLFTKDKSLLKSISILKNNKKFKFLTFPFNSVCKFFFKTTMYNVFMTLIVLPINLTLISCSGGQFNILSNRKYRGSINLIKYMTKIIALKIYQSNLNFIIFCPRLITNRNKRLIKTIFYFFKILNKSPITKIYLYRPVIRNGIRAKKIPRR